MAFLASTIKIITKNSKHKHFLLFQTTENETIFRYLFVYPNPPTNTHSYSQYPICLMEEAIFHNSKTCPSKSCTSTLKLRSPSSSLIARKKINKIKFKKLYCSKTFNKPKRQKIKQTALPFFPLIEHFTSIWLFAERLEN